MFYFYVYLFLYMLIKLILIYLGLVKIILLNYFYLIRKLKFFFIVIGSYSLLR